MDFGDCAVVVVVFFYPMLKNKKYAYPIRGPSQFLVCASVLRSLPPAAPPASPVAPALAHARSMLGRVLYAAAFFLLLIYTMDFQPTDKVEGVASTQGLKPRAGLHRGKQARTSTQREKPNAGLQRGKRTRASTQGFKPRAGQKKSGR